MPYFHFYRKFQRAWQGILIFIVQMCNNPEKGLWTNNQFGFMVELVYGYLVFNSLLAIHCDVRIQRPIKDENQ